VQEVDYEVEPAIHSYAGAVFDVLCIHHNVIIYILMFYY